MLQKQPFPNRRQHLEKNEDKFFIISFFTLLDVPRTTYLVKIRRSQLLHIHVFKTSASFTYVLNRILEKVPARRLHARKNTSLAHFGPLSNSIMEDYRR